MSPFLNILGIADEYIGNIPKTVGGAFQPRTMDPNTQVGTADRHSQILKEVEKRRSQQEINEKDYFYNCKGMHKRVIFHQIASSYPLICLILS